MNDTDSEVNFMLCTLVIVFIVAIMLSIFVSESMGYGVVGGSLLYFAARQCYRKGKKKDE